MKFEYELAKQDYIDFNLQHINNSKALKRSLIIQRYVVPIIFLIVPFILEDYGTHKFWWCLGLFVIVYIIWSTFYKNFFIWSISKKVSRAIDEGGTSNMIGKRTMVLDYDGISDISDKEQSKISWDAIDNIVETEKHIFIYINSMQGFIMPIRELKDKEKFLEILNREHGIVVEW